MPRRATGLLALTVVTSACAVERAAEPPPPFMLEEGAEPAAVESARPAVVTLAQAIREAVLHGPAVRAGGESVLQAEADAWTAALLPNPVVSLSSTLHPLPGDEFTQDDPGGPPQTDLAVAYPVDWLFGKRAVGLDVARSVVDVAVAQQADVVRLRVATVIETFLDVATREALLALAREDVEVEQGVERVNDIEVDRLRLARLARRAETRRLESELAGSRAALRALLGRGPDDPDVIVQADLGVTSPARALAVEEAYALAVERRPDLLALRRQVELAGARVTQERLRGLPQVQLQLVFSYQAQQDLGQEDVVAWGGGVGLSLPIFDRNQGNVARAESSARQSELALEQALLDVRAEVERAVGGFRAAHAAITEDLPVLRELAASLRARASGLGGAERLEAEEAAREARRQLVELEAEYWRALHAVNAAVGRQVLR